MPIQTVDFLGRLFKHLVLEDFFEISTLFFWQTISTIAQFFRKEFTTVSFTGWIEVVQLLLEIIIAPDHLRSR